MKVISLSGLPGVGKDYLAASTARIAKLHGLNAIVRPIAHSLKEFAAELYDFPAEVLFGHSELREERAPRGMAEAMDRAGDAVDLLAVTPTPDDIEALGAAIARLGDEPTARAALQDLGMWGRSVSTDLWVDSCIQWIEGALRGHDGLVPPDLVLVPDARFRNEYLALERAFRNHYTAALVIGPGRDGHPGIEAHPSDKGVWEALDCIDVIIGNDPRNGDSALMRNARRLLEVSGYSVEPFPEGV